MTVEPAGLPGEKAGSYPPLQLAPHDVLDHAQPEVAVVQAGNMGELLASPGAEGFGGKNRDLLQRFQAIADEARIEDRHPLDPFAGETREGGIRVGLQPLLRTEARLERDHQIRLVPP